MPSDFMAIQKRAYREAGIHIPEYKQSMVQRRLLRRLSALKLQTFADYVELLEGESGGNEVNHFINALTTNKTEFFRESHHFTHLEAELLPRYRATLAKDATTPLRLWSAGCSTGEEAYSMALCVASAIPEHKTHDIRILASDIDTEVLDHARIGRYRLDRLGGLPENLRRRYLQFGKDEATVSDEVKALLRFNWLNLNGPWPIKRRFDAIFCRNVMIYFDKPTQSALLKRFAEQLNPRGYLYIGHAETLYQLNESFTSVGQNIYRRTA